MDVKVWAVVSAMPPRIWLYCVSYLRLLISCANVGRMGVVVETYGVGYHGGKDYSYMSALPFRNPRLESHTWSGGIIRVIPPGEDGYKHHL
jgi:hypothetical protein